MLEKVIIRVDGCAQIGLGHVVRCIALAHMLKKEFHIHFFSKEIPDSIIQEIISNDFQFTKIENDETFFKFLTGEEIVVLDNYFFDTAYQKKIKEAFGCTLVCIDDLHDKEFYADLIINHAPGVKKEDYQIQTDTQFALGLDYVLLRPSFLKEARQLRRIKKNETIFVCFGGSDIKNITSRCLSVLIELEKFKKIIVVLGASFQNTDEVFNIVKGTDIVEIYQGIDENEMLDLLKVSDLAIVPASGILLEAISTGCAVITGSYVDNQKFIYQYYKRSNLIIDAGQFDIDSIKNAIYLSFEKELFLSRVIDGYSGTRINKLFLGLNIKLRAIVEEDCQLLFDWVNDTDVRTNALNTTNITWNDHLNWFLDKLVNSETRIFILERKGISIGQIRFDREDNYWKIDYSIDKKFRGMGMGSTILKLGLEKVEGEVKAWVKKENKISCILFEKLGFKEISETNEVNLYVLK